MSDGSAVRVADLLKLAAFADAEVVAGHSGLDRVVTRANIMEVPDIEPWVKPHELLLTTGYPLREVPQGLASLVSSLDRAGVSALGVKLRRYLDELPEDMLAEADRLGLPLVLLNDDVAFDDLLNAVLGDVLNRQSTILERSEVVHRTLVSVILDGGGLDELVAELGGLLDGQTFVTTTDGRVLAASDRVGERDLLSLPDVFVESGRFRSERFAPGRHRAGSAALAVVPVMAGKVDHGRLVVVREGESIPTADVHVLERAATVAALTITKSIAVQAVEAKYRGDFVRDVLINRAGPPEMVIAHFDALGWDVARPLVVVVTALDPRDPFGAPRANEMPQPDLRTAQDRFSNAWVTVVGRHDRAAPVVGFAQEVVALISIPEGTRPRDAVDGLVKAVSGDGGGGRLSFGTGVSRIIDDPAGIAAGYEQARRAVHVGRQLQGTSAVAHFDDLGAFRLLSLIEDVNELRNFVDEVLGELAHETDPEAADMRATLRVLLDTNFNVAETSRRLHFHYNTLRYRITKLERMVGPFTEDPDRQLDLSLALRVMQMRGL
ncbi:MAG: PucR family transcriptional regulator ligand-binding domain-containing protein [Nocardioidaceae bacterium]